MLLEKQCIIKFNQPNRNGRIYTDDCFKLDDPIIKEKLDNGTFFGEFGLPQDDRGTVDISKVSHRVVNLYKKEDGLYADIETLDTPNGRLLESLINSQKEVNFRTRGVGTITPTDNGNCLVTSFHLDSIDYTDNPA